MFYNHTRSTTAVEAYYFFCHSQTLGRDPKLSRQAIPSGSPRAPRYIRNSFYCLA